MYKLLGILQSKIKLLTHRDIREKIEINEEFPWMLFLANIL